MGARKSRMALLNIMREKLGTAFKGFSDDFVRLTKGFNDDVQRQFGDDAVRAGTKGDPMKMSLDDITKAERAILKDKSFLNYVDKPSDDSVNRAMSSFGSDFKKMHGAEGDDIISIGRKISEKAEKNFGTKIDPKHISDPNKLRSAVRDEARKRVYAPMIKKWTSELYDYENVAGIDRVYAKTLGLSPGKVKSARESGKLAKLLDDVDAKKIGELKNNLGAAVINNRILQTDAAYDKVFKRHALEMIANTISDDISTLAELAERNGNVPLAKACERMHTVVNHSSVIDASIMKSRDNINSMLDGMDEQRGYKIMDYIESKSLGKMRKEALTVKGDPKMVNVDRELQQRLGLADEDILIANKVNNTLRGMRKLHFDRFQAKTVKEMEDIAQDAPYMFDNIPDDDLMYVGEKFSIPDFGDFGINYFPISIKDEYKAKVVAAIVAKNPERAANFSRYGGKQMNYKFARSEGSVASQIMENRNPIGVTMDRYFNEYSRDMSYGMGKAHINNIGSSATIYDLFNASGNMKKGDDYKKAWKSMVRHIDDRWEIIFKGQAQPQGVISRFIANSADANTSMALGQSFSSITKLLIGDVGGFSKGQRLPAFNYLQALTNTGMMKGVMPVLGGMRMTPSLVKNYAKTIRGKGLGSILDKNNIQMALDATVAEIVDRDISRATVDYWKYENPDVLMQTLYTMDKPMQKFMNFITTSYRLSDITTRNVVVAASVNYAKPHYASYINTIERGGNKSKAIGHLKKALHMYEFGFLDRKYIMRAVDNPQKFYSRYAQMSVRSELYNYSRYFRPEIVDKMKTHWATARASRFLTWNMYYTNLLRGVYRSYQNGDKAPLIKLGMISAGWFGTMTAAGRFDNSMIEDWANYGVGRTPGLGPLVSGSMTTTRDAFGILAPSFLNITAPVIFAGDALADTVQGAGGKSDALDWAAKTTYNKVKNQPAVRWAADIIDELSE